MKRLLSTLVIAAAALLPAVADDYNYIHVVTTCCDTAFVRNEVRKLTFEAGNLVVTAADGQTTNFGLAVLQKINFTATADGIRTPGIATERLNLQRGRLVANGTGMLLIYDAQGRIVRQEYVGSSRSELNVSDLTRGIYIARLGQQTLKFIR